MRVKKGVKMITRRSLFGVLGALPLFSFLKEKEPREVRARTTVKPDIIITSSPNGFGAHSTVHVSEEVWKRFLKAMEDFGADLEKVLNKLVEDGFSVEIHHSDRTKEIRYRL